ncbi:AAA family ATPase, partial [Omnitrophica bacterium]|nr:AAA family ATPase [Candidatus Omnitrophota bacterium]
MSDKPEQPDKDVMETIRKMMASANFGPSVQEEKVRQEDEQNQSKARKDRLQFSLKPKEVKQHLDRYVIKQEEAKRVLATAICDHYNHIRTCTDKEKCRHYSKQNVLMLGPTGVGKTYLIRSISELIGVPFIKADATKFSETGYVGGDVEDLIRDLAHRADGDIELAECGMVYLDEI